MKRNKTAPAKQTVKRPQNPAPDQAAMQRLGQFLDAGRFQDAQVAARRLVADHPGHFFGWKGLGLALLRLGRPEEAASSLETALRLAPGDPYAHSLLGDARKETGDLAQALACYDKALTLLAGFPEALFKSGLVLQLLGRVEEACGRYQRLAQAVPGLFEARFLLGAGLHELGRLDEALTAYGTALRINPRHADLHFRMGSVLQRLGASDAALGHFSEALGLAPDSFEARFARGLLNQERGQLEAARQDYLEALRIRPNSPEACNNLGNALRDLGKAKEAIERYQAALQLRADFPEAWNNLGVALREEKRFAEAVASSQKALEIDPKVPGAHCNLGDAYREWGDFPKAVAAYQAAVALDPDYADAHLNLGAALRDADRLEEARRCFETALRLRPGSPEARNNLGNIHKSLGNLDEALANYQKALELRPENPTAFSNLLYLYNFTRLIPPEEECREARKWELIALNEAQRREARTRTFANGPRQGRRLRLGIVSAELGQHAVAYFLAPLLEHMDPDAFEITLFPSVFRNDPHTQRIKGLGHAWEPVYGLNHAAAAELIRSRRIDVLLDTTSHMKSSHLGVLARRAAPVQCHYIGYNGTSGLTEMDYYLGDAVLTPPSCEAHFTETLWRLPRAWFAYAPLEEAPEPVWNPASDGKIRLGAFNNLAKVREQTLDLWARVLGELPEGVLLLKDRKALDPTTQTRIREALARREIDPGRAEFIGHTPAWREHMALYGRLDVALDTVPMNSGTTAFDALWMGVPFVTLEGTWNGGRMGAAILTGLGRRDWIAKTPGEFVDTALALARDANARREIRLGQREWMRQSELCDCQGLAKALGEAFEAMFDRWSATRRQA